MPERRFENRQWLDGEGKSSEPARLKPPIMPHHPARKTRLPALLLAAFVAGGCVTASHVHPPAANRALSETAAARNNAASLLYDLLGDEQNVSKVLLIKIHSRELGNLIKLISATIREEKKRLDQMAQDNPGLELLGMHLPPGETAARTAEGKSKEHELLFSSGDEFEFNLLLTQAEALNYASHLAGVAAKNSGSRTERRQFEAVARTCEELYREVVVQMRARRAE